MEKTTTVHIPADIYRDAKQYAAREGLKMQALVGKAIRAYLKGK